MTRWLWVGLMGGLAWAAAADAAKEGATMVVIENDAMRVELSEEDFALRLVQKESGISWDAPAPFQVQYGPYLYNVAEQCRGQIECDGARRITVAFDSFEFWARFKANGYHKPDPGPDLKFEFAIILDDDHVVFRVEAVDGMDDEDLLVRFPRGLLEFDSTAPGRLVFPYGFGVMFEFPREDSFSFQDEYGRAHYSMPVYGLFGEQGGLGVHIRTPYDCRTSIAVNTAKPGRSSIENTFVFERAHANYAREIAFYPLSRGEGYVEWAKRYRRILEEEGRFVTLAEKIARNPEVEKLVGAVIWKHNVYSGAVPEGVEHGYSLYMLAANQNEYEGLPNNWGARELFDTAKERGFDRLVVYNTGWNRGGFDSQYPTRFPPNPERGTEDEFSQAAAYARSLSADYVYSVHDNYLDVYRNSPEFDIDSIVTTKDGAPRKGGVWRGGRAYLICTANGIKYAERDMPRVADMLGRGSIYIDVLGCVGLQACHHEAHPQGRCGDVAMRRRILQFIKDTMGSVATEGTPMDCLCDIVDLGAYCYYHYVGGPIQMTPRPVPVPFWQLVYHDSVLNYTSESTFSAYGSEYILYVALYGLLPTQLDAVSRQLSINLREAYRSEMVRHEFLVEPTVTRDAAGCCWTEGVARTEFGDGTQVVANFMQQPYECEGSGPIPARSFVIVRPDGGRVAGPGER
ncbi:MAG: hypothetical protein JXR94_05945 [Candidatus Hydrogenedentes bacterium]|nr:hypothetical protein [Candidatus Hydrogenedentota bacterium]